MADLQLSDIDAYLYDMKGPIAHTYSTQNVLMAAWAGLGVDGAPGRITPLENREAFNGKEVRFPVDLGPLEAGGFVAESGTVNVPIAPASTKGLATLKKLVQPFSISLEAMEDSVGPESAMSALQLQLTKATESLARIANVAMCGGGTAPTADDGALLAPVLSGSNLTWVLGTTTAGNGVDWDKFYVGQVVDVLTRSSGADAGQGKRRKIASITISTGTIVFDTASQASDGGSGSITASSSSGLYIPGSYGNSIGGGLESAKHATTFQSVVRSTYPQYNAVDGRAGDTTTMPFSDGMVDLGVILTERVSNNTWDFAVGDPNSINVYKNAKQNQVRYNVPTGTVAGRFTGVQIDVGNQSLTLVAERKLKPGSVDFLRKDAARIYGREAGPGYDDKTGTKFKQFNRTTNYEAWLLDRFEWCWTAPQQITYFENLSTQNSAG